MNDTIAVYVSGRVLAVVYDWNVAEDIASEYREIYPNKKVRVAYILSNFIGD